MKRRMLAGLLICALPGSIVWAAPAIPKSGSLSGQIVVDPEHPAWLMRQGGRHLFICGPGDPEDFLYLGTRNADGTRSGPQDQIIDKLVRYGGNSIYVQMIRTHGGDSRDDPTQNPFIDSDPAKGVDPRILAQWERWLTRLDDNNVLIYLFLYDDAARVWNTGDKVGPEERGFIETVVRKFQHHRNLIWMIAEESEEAYSGERVRAMAEVIKSADAHDHIIGDHHHNGIVFKAWTPGSALTHFSMQYRATTGKAHAVAIEARELAAGRYQIIYSENTMVAPDVAGKRRYAWAVAMGGLMPMLLRLDIVNTPIELLEQCRILQTFFESTDFYAMGPHDELKSADTTYVLADPGRSYIAYTGDLGTGLGLLNLPAGHCVVTWVNCVTGKTFAEDRIFDQAGDRFFPKPEMSGVEFAAWIRFPEIAAKSVGRIVDVDASQPKARGRNQPPRVNDDTIETEAGHPAFVQLAFVDDDGPGPYTYMIQRAPRHGELTGEGNDRIYRPAPGFDGTDDFQWRVNDGVVESRSVTVTIRISPPAAGNNK